MKNSPVLVRRINDAAGRVTIASESAQRISGELLDASERQSREIQQAGSLVQEMARSMTSVSGSALQTAQVARRSLEAARKGADAVQDSIKGMNEIREQIQETSKRIKRLGESSQEIGEIVELISDITEQTNVLALNAAHPGGQRWGCRVAASRWLRKKCSASRNAPRKRRNRSLRL